LSAPFVPGEQVVPAAQVIPAVLQETWQVIEGWLQHLIMLVRQMSPVAQSVSTVQSCVGGVTQNGVAHADETPAGSVVQ
jgi:hypothetical protein